MISDEMIVRALAEMRDEELCEFPDIPDGEGHVFSAAFEERMAKLIAKEKNRSRFNARAFARRAAAVVLVVFLGATSCVLGVDAWREQLFEMVERKFDEYSDIRYEPVSSASSGSANSASGSEAPHEAPALVERRPAYIPDGYILTSQILHHGINWSNYDALDRSGNFSFHQSIIGTVGSSINTEGSELTPFTKQNGDKAFKMSNGGAQFVLWSDERYEYMIVLQGKTLDEAVKIAESVELCPPGAPHPPQLEVSVNNLPPEYSEKTSIENGNLVIGADGIVYGVDRLNSFFDDYENGLQSIFLLTDYTKGNPFPTEIYFDGIRINHTVDETRLSLNPGEGQVGRNYESIERIEDGGITTVFLVADDKSRTELLRYPSAM